VTPTALASGNKFTWSKNGNTAVVFWRSFLDDAAYMTVSVTGRQRTGGRKMYAKVDFYSLRCAAGMNTCYSIGAGGFVSVGEGAEWHQIGHNRLDDLPRKTTDPARARSRRRRRARPCAAGELRRHRRRARRPDRGSARCFRTSHRPWCWGTGDHRCRTGTHQRVWASGCVGP
jgi:hypothetical protein